MDRSGSGLPINFEKVAMKQSDIDALANIGIIYDPITGDRRDAPRRQEPDGPVS